MRMLVLAVLVVTAGCSAGTVEDESAPSSSSPTSESEPVAVTSRPGSALLLPNEPSSRVVDEGHIAGVGTPGDGGSRQVLVLDLTSAVFDAVTVDLPEGRTSTQAWVTGGELYALAVECTEFVEPPGGAASAPATECLRGRAEVLSMPDPLRSPSVEQGRWQFIATLGSGDVGVLDRFLFAASEISYFTSGRSIARLDRDTGQITRSSPPRSGSPAHICGSSDASEGVVVVSAVSDPDASAEPNRAQNFSDFGFARLLPDGTWLEIEHGASWDPETPVLGGRCIGANPSLTERDTHEAWVLDPDNSWTSWGRLPRPGSLWSVSSSEAITQWSGTDIELHGPDESVQTIELAEPDDREPIWGFVNADGSYVGQYGDPARGQPATYHRGRTVDR